MIKLALTDLDNTLISFGLPHASDRARASMHAIMDAGLHVGPVTGRVPAAMRWMFAGDTACCATGAFINGQIVSIDGEVVLRREIDGALLDEVGQFLLDWDGTALALCDITKVSGISDGAITYVGATQDELMRHEGFFGTDYTLAAHAEDPTYIKTNIRCHLAPEKVADLQQELRARFHDLEFVLPMNGGQFIDILPAGWGKGKAVLFMADQLGVGLDEVAVFGDSDNDLTMLEAVPNSVTVANAVPEVAARARWHIGPSADDAVADAFYDIAAAAKTGAMPAFMR